MADETENTEIEETSESESEDVVEEAALEDDARARMYRLRRARFAELRSFLDQVEGFWADQLHAFKAHAERKYGRRQR